MPAEPIIVDLRRARVHDRPAHQAGQQEAVRMRHAVSHRTLDNARSMLSRVPRTLGTGTVGQRSLALDARSYAGNGGEARIGGARGRGGSMALVGVVFGQHV